LPVESRIVSVAVSVANGAIDFHGVPISLSYEPFARDAFRPLFEGFERCERGPEALQVILGTSAQPIAAPTSADWKPTFCHGLIQGYSRGGAHLLSDGSSRIEVSPRAGRISGEIFQSDEVLVAGMQHVALSLVLRERGIFDLHAATACSETRALVLIGDSGAGKTTLLVTLLELGCDFLGDDRLMMRVDSNEVELLAYPREFHLSAQTVALISRPVSHLRHPARALAGKQSVEPLRVWPERFRRSWRGRTSLLLPHIEPGEQSRVRRTSAAEAFGKLLSSSATVVVEAIEGGQQQLHALKLLADTADAYDVALGNDLLSNPVRTARRLLDELETLALAQ